MKKTSYVLLWVVFSLVIGCTSIGVPEKISSDDCLVIIKTKLINPNEVDVARYYHLHVTGKDKLYPVPNYGDGLIHIKINNDNTLIEGLSSGVNMKDYEGDSFDTEIGAKLPYIPGKVVVFDHMLVQEFKVISRQQIGATIQFEPIPQEEKKKIQKNVLNQKRYSSWQ